MSVTGGKESSKHPISTGAWPGPSIVLVAAPKVLDEAHDDRLSFRSREPFLVKDPPSPAGLEDNKTLKATVGHVIYKKSL